MVAMWPVLTTAINENKKSNHAHSSLEFWDTIKGPDLKCLSVERGETQTEDVEDSYAAQGDLEFALGPTWPWPWSSPCPDGLGFVGFYPAVRVWVLAFIYQAGHPQTSITPTLKGLTLSSSLPICNVHLHTHEHLHTHCINEMENIIIWWIH